MANPLVSIIVPSFNQGQFLRDTIESCLLQDYRPIEVLVIDGASTDGTVAILHQYDDVSEIRWISEPDSGVVEAVNKGFAMAQGEIGAIQSADDRYLPDALAWAVGEFRREPTLGLVYGDCLNLDTEGREVFRTRIAPFSIERFLSKQTWIPQCSTFFRLELVKSLGGWDSAFYNADTELWLRMVFRCHVRKVDQMVSTRTIHPGQRGDRGAEIVASYWKMIDTSADVQGSSRRLRRAALSGKYRHALRFNPTGSLWMATYYAWRATVACPSPASIREVAPFLLPGYLPCLHAFGRLKRMLATALRMLCSPPGID